MLKTWRSAPCIWLVTVLALAAATGCSSKAYKDYQPLDTSSIQHPQVGVTLKVVPVGDDLRLFSEFKADEVVLVVTRVKDGLPAARAGVRVGDLFLSLDGIRVRGMRECLAVMQRKQAGEPILLGIFRQGAPSTLQATLQ
ncbi:PDZ/DHR/GLGF domain protein [Solidesulfovibrio carbinoliphilus subsp. oakridgensis]|uniref:PDZ/DHR/GLGF domain protein n=1 Tax=Solidesulfovibrio carbinoliphilus subsp. oakridgensis TaxID=694327 RepID=G7Q648_9BACT|nr:PDZ domain-containing protein [Solidesulfovibrio carbinoliphilus]EHJ47064.1 PDZ/DHR/GLGF domain protein [Solidesulfovibrio carbinoliphilus subsp. oakridgensis]